MPNKDKLRVRASMPTVTPKSFFGPYSKIAVVSFIAAFSLVGLMGSACRKKPWREDGAALPMSGTCIDQAMRRYGPGDKDGKTCLWHGATYWCVYDPNKEIWSCDIVEPTAERKQ